MQIEQENEQILALLANNPQGLSRGAIAERLSFKLHEKTLQRRLGVLVSDGLVRLQGQRKAARYYSCENTSDKDKGHIKDIEGTIFSPESHSLLTFLDKPLHSREKVSYNREFLDAYVPNQSAYIPEFMRSSLLMLGKRVDGQLEAGTYAREICQRLLIDLSYNSSRLEGNTYSRLDTQRLVEEGVSADGKVHEETVMIMNHKEAILFLVENAQDVELNGLTIRNLHHLLSQDLLANPAACGNIRTLEVDIGHSAYKPLNNPHLLKELFELILLKAKKTNDPFEQSFFLLIHLSYLQAFEDVNKRTSRLICNLPFIKSNLCPLSFVDVARDDYTAALLALYEKNALAPMLELFTWAYTRSCQHYGVIKKSLGEIDPFRIQHRQQRKTVMGQIIRQALHAKAAEQWIENYCRDQAIDDVARFTAMTLSDLDVLHAGAIIGLGITEAQLETWRLDEK